MSGVAEYKEAMVLKILDLDACPAMLMENGRGEKIKLVDASLGLDSGRCICIK